MRLSYITLDVFTTSKFSGNPLAIVRLPQPIDHSLKQSIATEFNYSETVFLHDDNTIDIFTTTEELPFAGHPSVGSAWYILNHLHPAQSAISLSTKAGPIPAKRVGGDRVRLQTPMDFKIHPSFSGLDPFTLHLDASDTLERGIPVVSIVKGMTFLLLRLDSLDALAKLKPLPARTTLPGGYLGEYEGFVGLYAYVLLEQTPDLCRVRTRMFDGALEDPATGSAASALSGFLATQLHCARFEIVQGVEMGRPSDIYTSVRLDSEHRPVAIELEGSAVIVMEGTLDV